MAGHRRKKRRTHVKPVSETAEENAPKSFVIRTGVLTRAGSQLALDLRHIMEPHTAVHLREKRHNKLKDYVAVAGQLGVSHFMLISQTETSTNLRLAKFPNGPSLYFKIASYCLAKDVLASQKNPKSPGLEFSVPPLLVLNNFDVDSSEGKLMCSMLQGLFPTINTTKVKLADIRRVALFNYDKDTGLVELRHYLINVKVTGVSKVVKRIIRSEIPNLNDVADIGEYVLKAAAESESEYEQDSVVTLGQDYLGQANPKSSQRSVALTELGPRVSLKLVKIVDGFCAGETLYHANSQESNKASASKNILAKKKQKQAKAKKTSSSVIGN